ncbi:hypothetical protein Vadar_014890 [Vaccinium darrowii]|uniref:Uncharacterized protein n=1 Tax=Vaccinium darrowii TaxID=229202 RepID=A0ACB7ZKE3_9ERIC|nr:hypothetical protein Vadar_014890 [Vaccinium darrowii]
MFSSKEEMKYSMQKYSMDRNCAVKTKRSSPNVLVYICNNEIPCLWRLRAVKITDTEDWQITRYAGPHYCISRNEIIKIATQSYNPSYAKTWAAKTHAIAAIYGNWDESHAEVQRYLAEVKLYNPGTEAPGLMSYMPTDSLWRPPYIYNCYYARHIGANYMRRYNKKVGMQVKVTAMEGQKRKYKPQLSKMINWDNGKVHKNLMDLDLSK